MLKTKFDFFCAAEIQDEGEDVDVDEPTGKYGYLVGELGSCEGVMWEGGRGKCDV